MLFKSIISVSKNWQSFILWKCIWVCNVREKMKGVFLNINTPKSAVYNELLQYEGLINEISVCFVIASISHPVAATHVYGYITLSLNQI